MLSIMAHDQDNDTNQGKSEEQDDTRGQLTSGSVLLGDSHTGVEALFAGGQGGFRASSDVRFGDEGSVHGRTRGHHLSGHGLRVSLRHGGTLRHRHRRTLRHRHTLRSSRVHLFFVFFGRNLSRSVHFGSFLFRK